MKQSTIHDINLFARRGDDEIASPTFHTVTPACAWEVAYATAGYDVGWTLPLDLPHFTVPDGFWTAMLLEDTTAGLSIKQALFRTETEALQYIGMMTKQAQHLRETGVVAGGYRTTLRFPNNYIAELAQQFEASLAERTLAEAMETGSDSTLAMGRFADSNLADIMGVDDLGRLRCTSNFGQGMGIVYQSAAEWREARKLMRAEKARAEHLADYERPAVNATN